MTNKICNYRREHFRIKYCPPNKKSRCKGIGRLQRATDSKAKSLNDGGYWGQGRVWGTVLVSEGGRWPQNSLTGSDPAEKPCMYDIIGIWKVISGINIGVEIPIFLVYCM